MARNAETGSAALLGSEESPSHANHGAIELGISSPAKICIYTFTMGRTYYLNRLLRSVLRSSASYAGRIEHHLCCQGVELDPETVAIVNDGTVRNPAFTVHNWPENIGTPAGVNRIVPTLQGDLIIKMDEDCLILSDDFFGHVSAVARLKQDAIFSPYPVGLIGFAGGPEALSRHVEYSPETETYYTFRSVNHVGGFCRVSPHHIVRDWTLTPGKSVEVRNEDQQYSRLCRENGIDMFYLENALVVEHQESTLGQRARYGGYFASRPTRRAGESSRLRRYLRAGRQLMWDSLWQKSRPRT